LNRNRRENGSDTWKRRRIMQKWIKGIIAAGYLGLALLSFAGSAAAQQREEGRGFFLVGAQGMDIGNLNTRLRTNGYQTYPGTFLSLGGSGYGIRGRFLFGAEGVGVIGGNKSATIGTDLFKTSLNGGYGLFKIGYIVFRQGGLIVYPALGIGGGGLNLGINRQETVSFDSVLQDPRRSTNLGTGFFLIDLGVGADNLIILRHMGNREGGFAFGLRAGYLFAPFRAGWGDALNGPDVGIQGAYIRLALGGGGSRLQR
jgi:hypothetical protein